MPAIRILADLLTAARFFSKTHFSNFYLISRIKHRNAEQPADTANRPARAFRMHFKDLVGLHGIVAIPIVE